MRRLSSVVAVIGVLTLGVATALAFTPHVGTYGGASSNGHRVTFDTDTHHLHNFSLDYRELVTNVPLIHSEGIWSFHTHTEHWRVKGHWQHSTEVHGSICNLIASPSGCLDGEHLQTYTVNAKTPK